MKADKGQSENKDLEDPSAKEHADRRLFREAMRDVKRSRTAPSPPRAKVTPFARESKGPQAAFDRVLGAPKPRARARFRRLDEAAVLAESLQPGAGDRYLETGEEVSFKRQGVQDSVLRKLKRGEYRIEAEIDLHGLNVAQAKQALREFLQAMRRDDARCVRVIHGKGRRSGHQGPVLKSSVQVVLQKIDAVVAYASARPMDGGTGAVYVLLNWRQE